MMSAMIGEAAMNTIGGGIWKGEPGVEGTGASRFLRKLGSSGSFQRARYAVMVLTMCYLVHRWRSCKL